jgi:hypothetical protein
VVAITADPQRSNFSAHRKPIFWRAPVTSEICATDGMGIPKTRAEFQTQKKRWAAKTHTWNLRHIEGKIKKQNHAA